MGAIEPVDIKETEELRDELGALCIPDKVRLKKISKIWADVAGDIEPEDLLHEAMMKTIEDNPRSRRRCPTGVELVKFLSGVMRSLANNRVEWRKRRKEALAAEIQHPEYDLLTAATADETYRTPEEELLHAEHEQAFHAFLEEQCKGCGKTHLVLLGGFDGLRGQDLCDFAGVTKKELATIHRRIARMMDRFKKERSQS